jgi:type II secretory pathway component PulC
MKSGYLTITKLIKDIRKIGLKQKLIIILILSICFLIGFIIPLIIQNKNNFNRNENQIKKPQAAADLEISSNKKVLKVYETFTATILINSPTKGIEAADFFIKFDPNYLNLISQTPGSFFSVYPIQQIENNYFKLSGIAKKLDKGFIIPKGKGTVATLLFKAIKPVNSTTIEIDRDKTIIAAEGENILDKISNLKIKIN